MADSQPLRIGPLSLPIGVVLYHVFSNTLCLGCCGASNTVLTNVSSHKLCILLGDQYVLLDPLFFFVPCVPEAQLLYALSSPFEHSVPLWAYSQLQLRSAAVFLFCYQMQLAQLFSRSQIKPPMCFWLSPRAEKHQQPPKDNKWLVIIWKGTENKIQGFFLLSKTILQPYPVSCMPFVSLQLKDIVELEKALEKYTEKTEGKGTAALMQETKEVAALQY